MGFLLGAGAGGGEAEGAHTAGCHDGAAAALATTAREQRPGGHPGSTPRSPPPTAAGAASQQHHVNWQPLPTPGRSCDGRAAATAATRHRDAAACSPAACTACMADQRCAAAAASTASPFVARDRHAPTARCPRCGKG